jgi:hypothetical protein
MDTKLDSIELTFHEEWSFLAPWVVESQIRVGRNTDGGYVVPTNALSKVNTLISLGLSTDWSFDLQLQQLIPNINIHAYDHTICEHDFKREYRRGIFKFLKGKLSYQDLIKRRDLYSSYRSFFSGNVKHFQERIHNRIDNPTDATIDVALNRTESNNIFLKVDIEGAEYRIIDDILRASERIQVLVIEFHDTDPLLSLFFSAIKKIQDKYDLVHLHINNYGKLAENKLPEVIEMTFVAKGLVKLEGKRKYLPLPELDYPCNLNEADYRITFLGPKN